MSWQIIPTVLGEMLGDRDPRKAQNVMQAMLQMTKIDIETLRQAYEASLAPSGGRRASDEPWSDDIAHRTIDAVWRIESARLIAGLARIVRDVGLAEDLAQDALVIALEQWPESGIPDNPGAWLMATAKHRAIDRLRRNKLSERKHEELGRELEIRQETGRSGFRRRARRRGR